MGLARIVAYTKELDECLEDSSKKLIEENGPNLSEPDPKLHVIEIENNSGKIDITYEVYSNGEYKGRYQHTLVLNNSPISRFPSVALKNLVNFLFH